MSAGDRGGGVDVSIESEFPHGEAVAGVEDAGNSGVSAGGSGSEMRGVPDGSPH